MFALNINQKNSWLLKNNNYLFVLKSKKRKPLNKNVIIWQKQTIPANYNATHFS